MSSAQGRSIKLFLVDGLPTGIRTAEIMNWTGHVLVAPRSQLPDALRRPEVARTGVYLLTGDDPTQPGRQRVYVGEGDNVIDRLKNHAKDASKDFWTQAAIVTSKDTNLTKAHVRYLEARLVELAKEADRANVANGNEPKPKQLPESDSADMEFFITQLQIVLPVLSMDFLRPTAMFADSTTDEPVGVGKLELVLQKHDLSAVAVEQGGEVTIIAGSQATVRDDYVVNTYGWVRQGLIDRGVLKLSEDQAHYVFAENVPCRSPTEASSIILNRNSNGRTEWKVRSTGQTLKEWQDKKLKELPDRPPEDPDQEGPSAARR